MLDEEKASFCLLSETHFNERESEAFAITGYQHLGKARSPHGGDVSLLVQNGIGIVKGSIECTTEETITATLVFNDRTQLQITSAYYARKTHLTDEALTRLRNVHSSVPLVIGADVNSHHPLRDPLRPADVSGDCLLQWCLPEEVAVANPGAPTRRKPGTTERSSPDVTLHRNCTVGEWRTTLRADSDPYGIASTVTLGKTLEGITPSRPRRRMLAWAKAAWPRFRRHYKEEMRTHRRRRIKSVHAWHNVAARAI